MPERQGGREALNERQQDLENGKAFTYSVTWRKQCAVWIRNTNLLSDLEKIFAKWNLCLGRLSGGGWSRDCPSWQETPLRPRLQLGQLGRKEDIKPPLPSELGR